MASESKRIPTRVGTLKEIILGKATVFGRKNVDIPEEGAMRGEKGKEKERATTEEEEDEEKEKERAAAEEDNEKEKERAAKAEEEEKERVKKAAEEEEEKEKERAKKAAAAEEEKKKKEKVKERAKRALYEATLSRDIRGVIFLLNAKLVTLGEKITINGNTALHVAVGTSKDKVFVENMLDLAIECNQEQLNMVNSEGSTLLHIAAIVGNTDAADMLIQKNPRLLVIKDNANQTPLARALSNMHKDTYILLLKKQTNDLDIEAGTSTCGELLPNIISSKDYGSAVSFFLDNVEPNNMSLANIDSVLMAIAQNFPSKPNFWEKNVHKCMFVDSTCFFSSCCSVVLSKFKFVQALKRKVEDYHNAKDLLDELCLFTKRITDSKSHHDYYNNVILEATKQNADAVVKMIVSEFPNAIWSTNEHGHNIIQYAVINRSEKVYNLLYQMSEHKNTYRTIKDNLENNLLHLAARLAPPGKLDHISGAALQIQHELQWFKEVEGFVCPLNLMQKNWFGETPQMVFTREHKELVIDGEKWMKETAQSYTITTALIITIVFAAAITVPGGNKQDNGIPVFANKTAFKIFALSDAISLFTSVTSLLVFLSILTARFSEQDFLYKLPRKLLFALITLFISTTAMLIAFGATLFLMFGQDSPRILVCVAALTCLPIICFATLHFPLIKDLMSSTYGRSIFGKKSDRPFY